MRLINTRTLRLREFTGRVPPYAILSHTWGKREVSLSEFRRLGSINDSKSLAKIRSACQQAFMDGLEYVWVDTCCIDKSSTAELSETINSMFEYYRRAQVCYALLEDVPSPDPDDAHNPAGCFWKSRWFTRGWTLQELIAPYHVHFFNQSWSKIGEKKGLTKLLESITGVDESVLSGGSLQHISVGRRMSWASNRRTTRPEDVAYSLLGIFDINMPMLYGEGMKAFIRLQEEILRQSDDQSLLAWRCTEPAFCSAPARGLLASSPRDFANFRSRLVDHGPKKGSLIQGDDIVPFQEFHEAENLVEMTNRGIRITSVVHDLQPQRPFESLALGLNCCTGDPGTSVVGIYLERHSGDRYVRARPSELAELEPSGQRKTIYGLKSTREVATVPYDSTWMDSSRAFFCLKEMYSRWVREPARHGKVGLNGFFQHAFVLQNSRIETRSANFFTRAVFLKDQMRNNDSRPFLHSAFYAEEASVPKKIVIPTNWKEKHSGSTGSLVLCSDRGKEALLIVVGVTWDEECSTHRGWVDCVVLPDMDDALDIAYVTELMNGSVPSATQFQEKVVSFRGRGMSIQLLVSVRPDKFHGVNIFYLDVTPAAEGSDVGFGVKDLVDW